VKCKGWQARRGFSAKLDAPLLESVELLIAELLLGPNLAVLGGAFIRGKNR
jgi:hypothetical protein